eukprot:gene3980-7236_t
MLSHLLGVFNLLGPAIITNYLLHVLKNQIQKSLTKEQCFIFEGVLLFIIWISGYIICKLNTPNDKKSLSNSSEGERNDFDIIEQEQVSIRRQIQSAVVFIVNFVIFCMNHNLFQNVIASSMDKELSNGKRIALALKWLCLPVLTYILAIVNVGLLRYPDKNRSKEVTNGVKTNDEEIRIPLSFLSNTSEQILVHIVVILAVSVTVPDIKSLELVPILAILFVLGRINYYLGYTYLPVMRAYGFSFTIFPNALGCLYVIANNFLAIDILQLLGRI